MNRIISSFLLAAVTACTTKKDQSDLSAQSSATLPCGNELMSGRGIGELVVGRNVDSIKRVCHVISDSTELGAEGMPTRILRVAFSRDTVEAEIDSSRVWRIEVASRNFKTSDSIGVGTSIERLLRLKEPKGLGAEGAVFLVSPEHCGLSFQLSESGSDVPPENWDRAALAGLPKSTVVDRVLIVGCDPTAS
jgi:hypothetical protein